MNYKTTLAIFLFFTNIAESSFEHEKEKEITSKNSFVSNALGKLYSLTSITGYDSYPLPIFDFLKSHPHLKNFEEKTFEDSIFEKEQIQNEFNICALSSSLPIKTFSSGMRKMNGKCLWNESENNLIHVVASSSSIEFTLFSNQVDSCTFAAAQFDISYPSTYGLLFIKRLLVDFKDKDIHLHSLLRSNKPAHFCYLDLQISANQSEMNVLIFDPVPTIAYKTFFEDISKKAKSYFSEISEELKIDLNFNYRYRCDQLSNKHDCGRFSTIYLLNSLKKNNIETLTGFDIYNGFKELEKNGYETFHQTPSIYYQTGQVSTVAKIFKYTRRIPIDLFLSWWEKKEK